MDLLSTDRTYKTRVNAIKALEVACEKVGVEFGAVMYVIATNDAGRFAPVVIRVAGASRIYTEFAHNGVTITG